MTSAPAKEAGLLPCPHCGSPAVSGSNFDDQNYVMCSRELDQCGSMIGWQKTQDRAIAAWNTRAPSPSPDQPAGEDKDALIRDLTARAEAAEEALRPFATVGALIDRYFADRPDDVVFQSGAGWTDADGKSRTLTLGHFRRALCVLAALANEAKDGRAG